MLRYTGSGICRLGMFCPSVSRLERSHGKAQLPRANRISSLSMRGKVPSLRKSSSLYFSMSHGENTLVTPCTSSVPTVCAISLANCDKNLVIRHVTNYTTRIKVFLQVGHAKYTRNMEYLECIPYLYVEKTLWEIHTGCSFRKIEFTNYHCSFLLQYLFHNQPSYFFQQSF